MFIFMMIIGGCCGQDFKYARSGVLIVTIFLPVYIRMGIDTLMVVVQAETVTRTCTTNRRSLMHDGLTRAGIHISIILWGHKMERRSFAETLSTGAAFQFKNPIHISISIAGIICLVSRH